ncbi:BCCT family transporter [Hyphomonas johnsonii]|uniref:Choline/carnitine/betaine transporter n=1 Tax=Hyphomonas johnsonii MHS-2 TaxID=1280950 RepID=A0A059FQP0_9PROT|nr:BCCT family transporter [Hyphomonas johnsonii]KCZ92964.1 choline/carnitine/betaine transporter [Hyphomonas johnsonii MHS-2]
MTSNLPTAPTTPDSAEPTLNTEYDTEYEIGQDNIEVLGLDIHNPVFFMSAGLVIFFSVVSLVFPESTNLALADAKTWTLQSADWLFAITPVIVLLFCLSLAVSPLGRIRLGGADATPDFKIHSWVAMLFAAGVGIGFMFYGSAEPLAYYTDWFGTPLAVAPGTPAAERLAFSATIFHWGLAPWAIYAIVGLALGFFAHNKGLPLSIRSAFYPVLGDRIFGWPGHIIDLFAVVSTVFGLATTIGIGATQATSGLAYLFGFEQTRLIQILLILAMTGLAVLSVVRGMDGGVKLLSNINMGVAFALLMFVVIAGPTVLIFTGMGENLLNYVKDTPALTNWVGREDINWFHDWTIFYWAWWISWSPFVGMFIARISRGRTVREYFAVVLLAPFTICVVWFSAFGETAIAQHKSGVGELAGDMTNASITLFEMLHDMPFPEVTSGIAILLLIVFIVTSADSGALVIDTITSGGKADVPVVQRVFWACMLGVTASALLYGGGTDVLRSLQAGTITAALPFTVILLVCCLSLYIGMRDEHAQLTAGDTDST